MFENNTYELLLQNMLDRIPDNIDKREGSIIHDALAPCAIELQNVYIALDMIMNEGFADTASWEYLVKRAAERGILPQEATHAVLKGEFVPETVNIPIGTRFNGSDLNYRIIKKITNGIYNLECEEEGVVGNQFFGNIIPIDYVEGLEIATITELIIPGEDEEDTESIRNRYFSALSGQSFGGNVADYKDWISQIQGVGGVKVYPVWNGGGTVKLVIINSEYKKPSDELIAIVQEKIDPILIHGQGLGIAPIGHTVTVEGVQDTVLNIETTITYQDGFGFETTKVAIKKVVDDYIQELNEHWKDEKNLIVRISQIETRMLNANGVLDIKDTKINGVQENYVVAENSIVIRGDIIA